MAVRKLIHLNIRLDGLAVSGKIAVRAKRKGINDSFKCFGPRHNFVLHVPPIISVFLIYTRGCVYVLKILESVDVR